MFFFLTGKIFKKKTKEENPNKNNFLLELKPYKTNVKKLK